MVQGDQEKYLENIGIRIVRFENKKVFQEPEVVLETIKLLFNKD